MPIVLKKHFNITGNYTDSQKLILTELITDFRVRIFDDDPNKNILNSKKEQYTDNKIVGLLKVAIKDVNGGSPQTNYTMFNVPEKDLLVNGAMVFAMIGEGILQLRNQISYSDSGLSIGMFDKTGQYQSWASFIFQNYLRDKAEFKSSIIVNSENSGFVGISSEFGYRSWWP